MITGYLGVKPKPDWAKWQAIDRYGNVIVYAAKPAFRNNQWYPPNGAPYTWVNLCIPLPCRPEQTLTEI